MPFDTNNKEIFYQKLTNLYKKFKPSDYGLLMGLVQII
jgi:hypothetical protein